MAWKFRYPLIVSFITNEYSQCTHKIVQIVLASSMHAIERLTAYLWAFCLLRKILEYFEVTRNWFCVPKNKRKRDPNYSSNCLGTVEKWRFTLTKCTAFTTCIPYVYPIFMVCCHFLETIARAFFFFLSAYWFMLTNTDVISCGLFMLLIASSIFGYGSMLEHLKDTLV